MQKKLCVVHLPFLVCQLAKNGAHDTFCITALRASPSDCIPTCRIVRAKTSRAPRSPHTSIRILSRTAQNLLPRELCQPDKTFNRFSHFRIYTPRQKEGHEFYQPVRFIFTGVNTTHSGRVLRRAVSHPAELCCLPTGLNLTVFARLRIDSHFRMHKKDLIGAQAGRKMSTEVARSVSLFRSHGARAFPKLLLPPSP